MILHVKQILGHKSINSTLLYTQLVNFKENDYDVKVANDVKEISLKMSEEIIGGVAGI